MRAPARGPPPTPPASGRGDLSHQRRGDVVGGIDADRGRLRREGAHVGDEGARGGQCEMSAHRINALPLLDERQTFISRAIPSLSRDHIDMAMMRQTPRLAARPRAMLGAERNHALAMLGGEDDVAGDEDQIITLS